MEQSERDQAIWFYQLGGKALGPVAWTEIEALIADSADEAELLVARDGDDAWRPAADVVKEMEEAEDAEEDEAAGEEAAAEAEPEAPLVPVHGLGPWLSQAWRIVRADGGRFFSAGIMLIVLSSFSLLLCLPALHAGLYIMALKGFRGEKVEAGTIFEGFHHFWRAFALYLVMSLLALPVAALVLLALVIVAVAADAPVFLGQTGILGFWLGFALGLVLPGAIAFYAMPLIVDRDLGAWEAVKASWAVTKTDFLSYVGMQLSFSAVSILGLLACFIFWPFSLPMLPAGQVVAYQYHFRDR